MAPPLCRSFGARSQEIKGASAANDTGPEAYAARLSASGGPPHSRLEPDSRPRVSLADAEQIQLLSDQPDRR